MNLQFLSLNDYLMRNYHLLHLETAFQIRQDLEVAIQRMHVVYDAAGGVASYDGWCRMAIPLDSLLVHDVAEPRLGETWPR